jgi:hypothetical protein
MKRLTNLTLFVCGFAAIGGSLFAESLNSLQVHVPFDFIAAGRKLPAGDYVMSESDGAMVIRISGNGPGNSVMLAARPGGVRSSGGSSASFEQIGADKYLSELHMADDRVLQIPLHPAEPAAGVGNAMTGGR